MEQPIEKVPNGVSVASVKKVITLSIRVKDCDGEGKDRIFAYGVEAENEAEARETLAGQLTRVVRLLKNLEETGAGGGGA